MGLIRKLNIKTHKDGKHFRVRKLHLYYIEASKSQNVPSLTQLGCSKKTMELTQLTKSQMEQINSEHAKTSDSPDSSIFHSDVPGNQLEMALTRVAAIQMLVLSPEVVGLTKSE